MRYKLKRKFLVQIFLLFLDSNKVIKCYKKQSITNYSTKKVSVIFKNGKFKVQKNLESGELGVNYGINWQQIRESYEYIISLSWACIPPETEVIVSPCKDKPTGTPEQEGCGTSMTRLNCGRTDSHWLLPDDEIDCCLRGSETFSNASSFHRNYSITRIHQITLSLCGLQLLCLIIYLYLQYMSRKFRFTSNNFALIFSK